jgi:DNA polymerase elongation subunit (family B)
MDKINDALIFQILDWDEYNYVDDDGEDAKNKYVIRLFGKTKLQKSVYLEIINFSPYFYIEIPNNWELMQIKTFIDEVKKNVYGFGKDLSYEERNIKNNALKDGLIDYKRVKKNRFYGFTNYTQFAFLHLRFENMESFKAYERALKKYYDIPKISKKSFKVNIYESNLPPMLRFMHTKKLDAVGWLSIQNDKLIEDTYLTTCCDIEYQVEWLNIEPIEDRSIEKFIIMSFDIECTSKDGSFPQPEREEDKIIQIGMTMSRFGEDECYEKHLLSLGETADIDGSIVHWYETEQELLLGFTKLMRKINPDIITGYNIFGFDFKYIKKRAEKLKSMMTADAGDKFLKNFEKLSRINNETSEWIEKILASSALGENLLYYYKMTGRVLVDLMKVVQKDYKLSSYKLDYVASNFIRENIINLENNKNGTFNISSKSTFGISNNDYITIGYFDGAIDERYEEGKKFKIIELTKNTIVADGQIDTTNFMGKGYKVYWSQAKDDISPSDIFRMCKGTPEERAIIGKYCIMDCTLCNKLISKLQIITNNIGMANVCHIPLSFLFLRGQGIKIFSLVAKKCREKSHLIPVLKKKFMMDDKNKNNDKDKKKQKITHKNFEDDRSAESLEKHIRELNMRGKEDQEEEDDDGYEGAIVFPPEPKVWFEPIYVLDYASLYPNSMRLRNLSHECLVNDNTYLGLPGYKYHKINYRNNNNEMVTCCFAEKKDGTKGIIPDILFELLSARKKYKKLMNNEPDPFKKSVLDGLQQAYKVTANSLYGQTGASTSSIFMKEIAASTTATGREAVQFAKYFIETFFSPIVNYALTDKKKFLKEMEQLYKYYPTSYETVHPDGYDITIYVNTDENEEIPPNKYVCREIEYEINYKVIYDIIDLKWNLIFDKLYDKNPILRTKFIEDLKNYVWDITDITAKDIYREYADIWNTVEINNFKELKELLLAKLIYESEIIQEKFFENLRIAIDDIGYKNREHFFEKVYESMNNILNGYSIDAKIMYGDSVTEDTPILLRNCNNNEIEIITMKNIGKQWDEYYDDKLQDFNINYEAWTEKGWSKIKRIIKHKTNKKIYGITTYNSYVQVTEDHSLLDYEGNKISPKECKNNTELLQSFVTNNHVKNKILDKVQYEKIMTSQKEALELYYKLKLDGYNISLKNINDEKWVIYWNNDGDVQNKNYIVSITELLYNDEKWVYDLETDNHHFQAGIGELIVHNTDSVFCCPHIKNNRTGEMMTNDSSQIQAIKLGIWSSLMIGILLPEPMKLEYEKVLWPFVIQGKKRYVGNLYEKDPTKFVQKSMGIELKRRDNAPIVKTVSAGIINLIVNERNPEGAFEYMRDILEKIIHGDFKMDKFVITKTLKGNACTKEERIIEAKKPKEQRIYKERSRIVHAVLADRMADRDPGNKPMSNDRIPYAYIETKFVPDLQGDRVETPEYIIENKLKLDTLFYITNQIMKPALKFLDLITTNAGDLFKDYIVREENRKKGVMPLSYYGDSDKSDDDYFDDDNSNKNERTIKKTKNIKKVKKIKTRADNNTSINVESLLVDFD